MTELSNTTEVRNQSNGWRTADAKSLPYPATSRQWLIAGAVGAWQAVWAVVTLIAVFWSWNIAERLTSSATTVHVRWIGPDFAVGATTAALLLAAVAGAAGSMVHTIGLYSSRVGRRTFEGSYVWWYVLRPFSSVLLAVLFMAAVRAGQVGLGTDETKGATPMLAFLAGGLAGLFTDRVLQQLRALLGATSVERKASEQRVPGAAAPVPEPQGT